MSDLSVTVETMLVVVGIPTKNESATIAGVAAVVDRGLSQYFPWAEAVIVNADNNSLDGTRETFLAVPTQARKIALNTGDQGTGKGTNVFAIMEQARALDADGLVLIDGDLRSAEPEWIRELMTIALEHVEPTFVTPEYCRSRYEANSTNQLVRPYLRAAFGLDVRQPIGGEFAMNRTFIDEALQWSRAESTNLYGIDVWLTANAALRGFTLEQVAIGQKVHSPTFPKIYKLGQQVLDALFRLMLEHRPATPNSVSEGPSAGLQIQEGGSPLPLDMVTPITDQASRYITTFWDELCFTFPSLIRHPRPAPGDLPMIHTELWCEILSEAYLQLTVANFRRIRDHVVALFPARVVTYWSEIEGMTAAQVDELLDNQSRRLAELFSFSALPQVSLDVAGDPALLPGYWDPAPKTVHLH